MVCTARYRTISLCHSRNPHIIVFFSTTFLIMDNERMGKVAFMRFMTLLFGIFLHLPIFSQECRITVSGSISDADAKTPLDKAVIRIVEADRVSVSDEEGHYHFYNLCKGTYTFVITHVSCEPVEVKVRLTENLVRNFVLPHRSNLLQEVTVTGTRESQPGAVRDELSKRDLSEARSQTLGEILKRISGVTVLQTGTSIFKPVIHGLHSQRVLILNNGVRQEGQQWGSEHAPEIDPFIADRFIVLKGAGALRYGSDAIAGAILIEPRAMPTDQAFRARLNTAFFTNNRQYVTSVMAEQNLPNRPSLSWRAHMTHKRGGNARTPDYWLYNTGMSELNYSLAGSIRKPKFRSDLFFSAFNTRIGIFMGSHIGNLSDLGNAILQDKPLLNIDRFSYVIDRPYQQVSHYLAKSKSVWFLKDGGRMNLQLSQQINHRQEYDRAMITDRPELDLNIGTTTADAHWEQDPLKKAHALVGASLVRQENVWSGSRFFIPNFITWNPSVYAIERYSKDRWMAEGGLRFDYRSLTTFRNKNGVVTSERRDFANISGTAGVTRRVGAHVKLLGNAALAWRAPNVNELYVNGLHHGTASFEIGDSTLAEEKAFNFSGQIKYEADTSWDADLTLYANFINGFINLVPQTPPTLTLRGAFPTFRYIQTDALLYGADFRVERTFSRQWSSAVKGSFLWARDRQKNDWLQQMPANRLEGQLTWSFAGKRFRNGYVSPSVLYVFRQDRVPSDGVDYLPPPDAYALLHLEFATSFDMFRKNSTLNIGVQNLLNRKYRDYMNRFRYFNDEMGRNVIIQLKIDLF